MKQLQITIEQQDYDAAGGFEGSGPVIYDNFVNGRKCPLLQAVKRLYPGLGATLVTTMSVCKLMPNESTQAIGNIKPEFDGRAYRELGEALLKNPEATFKTTLTLYDYYDELHS